MNADLEVLHIRRRNRLRHHFTMTSNVILFGYDTLTDAERVTFQAVDSFDWSDSRGERKGYAYPTLRTLATLRGTTERTIRRHLRALERVGLLTRELRPGQPSFLWIEEPSAEESEAYLERFHPDPDTDVRGTPDADVRPNKKDEKTNRQNHVNAIEHDDADARARRDWLAQEMLKTLGDQHSLGFYRSVAATVPEHRVFEALSEVRLASREQRVLKSKGALFAAIVRRHRSSAKGAETTE